MKTIAAHAPIGDRGRQGKCLRNGFLRTMKCRIETRNLRELGCTLGDRTDGLQVVRLMQRCERNQPIEFGEHLCVDTHWRRELHPAMDYATTNGEQLPAT